MLSEIFGARRDASDAALAITRHIPPSKVRVKPHSTAKRLVWTPILVVAVKVV